MTIEDIIASDLKLRKKGNFYYCFSGTHEDKNPSMSFWKTKNKFKCFSCGFKYDIFDHKRNGYKFLNDSNYISNQSISISYSQPRDLNNFTKTGKYINNYFKHRKIDLNAFDFLNLRQSSNYKVIIFPIYNEFGTHISNKYRNVDTKTIYFDKNTNCKTFYNINNTDINRPLFITEGESDLLSVLTAFKNTNFKNVVSLSTGVNSNISPNMINLLKKFPEVVLCFDNDEAGQTGQKKLFNILLENNVNCSLFKWGNLKFNDLNDILTNTNYKYLKNILIDSCKFRAKKNHLIN